MHEYTQMANRTNKIAQNVAAFLFTTALVLLAFSAIFNVSFSGVYQSLSIICLSTGTLILTAYVMRDYRYSVVKNDDGSLDLTVTEVKKKSNITVCRVSLAGIEAVEIYSKERADELRKKGRGRKTFSYFPEISPPRQCWVYVSECGEDYLLKLVPDDELLRILELAAEWEK